MNRNERRALTNRTEKEIDIAEHWLVVHTFECCKHKFDRQIITALLKATTMYRAAVAHICDERGTEHIGLVTVKDCDLDVSQEQLDSAAGIVAIGSMDNRTQSIIDDEVITTLLDGVIETAPTADTTTGWAQCVCCDDLVLQERI